MDLKTDILSKLEKYNDSKFVFEPVEHKYTYEDTVFTSVTTYIQNFHKKFDTDYWSEKKASERGITQEEILLEWKTANDYSNDIGTQMHEWIESYYKKEWKELPKNADVINRINKFNNIYVSNLHKLTPVAFEQRIFSRQLKLAGTIDSIFINPENNHIYILDWKSNKAFHTDATKKFSKLLAPFNKFYENQLNEYSIQLSLYALILKEVGIEIQGMFLVHIPHEGDAKIYKAVDMRDILNEYFSTHHN